MSRHDNIARPDVRLGAAVGLLVWVVGFELLPTAHLARHADGPAHSHGGVTHVHATAPTENATLHHADAGEHGAASVAHRDLAVHPDVPALPALAPPRLGLAPSLEGLTDALGVATPRELRARAPPRVARAT